jgi:hypothetical protein
VSSAVGEAAGRSNVDAGAGATRDAAASPKDVTANTMRPASLIHSGAAVLLGIAKRIQRALTAAGVFAPLLG